MASGSEVQLQNFIEWCKKGPQKAIVTYVVITKKGEENFKNFEIVRKK
jgi:acylphosphatase